MRTEVKIEKSDLPFGYGQKIIFMGSCFSEHIGSKLEQRKFDVDLNPFGVLYNPVSIASGLQRMLHGNPYSEEDLFFHQGWWHSFDHHGRFSHADKATCLEDINKRLAAGINSLRKSQYIFVTFGTAKVFHKLSSGRVVSNCHQVPADQFEIQLLRVGDIVRMYSLLIQEVAAFNRDLKWVFTVSPVRHWKNGPVGNQISKASLLLAVSELNEKFKNTGYFPAYEIFMDDLRDYRYYADDMLHPGSQGIEYTWDKFVDSYISPPALSIMKSVESLIRAANHRPRNTPSLEYRDFMNKNYTATLEIAEKHPEIDLKEFIEYFSTHKP